MSRVVILALAAGLGWFMLARPAWAQDGGSVGLSVVPAIIDQPLTPGVSTTISIEVANISDQPLPVQVDARPLTPIDPLIDASLRERYDASAWLEVLTPELILAPGQAVPVQLVVTAADNAGVGGHYALVVFRVLSGETPANGSAARVNPEVTSLVMFNLPGELNEQLELRLDQPPLWQIWPINDSALHLMNRGNVHILPQINTRFQPILAGAEASGSVSPHLVLPGTDSAFELDWPDLEWGLYRLEVEADYGTPLKSSSGASRYFVVPPPLWLQLIMLSALVALGWVLIKLKRRIGPLRRRKRKIASDEARLSRRGADSGELDYLSREPDTKDITRRPRS